MYNCGAVRVWGHLPEHTGRTGRDGISNWKSNVWGFFPLFKYKLLESGRFFTECSYMHLGDKCILSLCFPCSNTTTENLSPEPVERELCLYSPGLGSFSLRRGGGAAREQLWKPLCRTTAVCPCERWETGEQLQLWHNPAEMLRLESPASRSRNREWSEKLESRTVSQPSKGHPWTFPGFQHSGDGEPRLWAAFQEITAPGPSCSSGMWMCRSWWVGLGTLASKDCWSHNTVNSRELL